MKKVISVIVLILVVLVGLSLFLGGDSNVEKSDSKGFEINPSEVVEKINNNENIILLDVRTPEEYSEVHIESSILLPVQELSADTLDKVGLGENSRNKEIIIYCGSGVRSAQAYEIMNSLGYTNIKSVAGGVGRWQEENLPYLKGFHQNIIGIWQSTDDSKSVVVIKEDGSTQNIYDDEILDNGSWELYTKEGVEFDPSGFFLRTTIEGEIYEYAILDANDFVLTLSYLARGNTLNYRKVNSLDIFNTTSNEDWSKYESDLYDVSFDYPNDWEVVEALKPQNLRAEHEIVVWQKEYDLWRASLTVNIFANEENLDVNTWWDNWLKEEDAKETECREEYGDQSPCLYLRGLIELEKQTVFAGKEAVSVTLFQFDHEKECTYFQYEKYVYGLCSASVSPNDPLEKENKEITDKIRESFSF